MADTDVLSQQVVVTKPTTEANDDTWEHLENFSKLRWTMFDGENFDRKVYNSDFVELTKEEMDDVITYRHATLMWTDRMKTHTCSLVANEITIGYVVNSILYRYKRMRMKPLGVYMLDSVKYDPFHNIIKIEFGS